MKLLSICLHPFGGTANRTCTFHDGINVLEGPNEFGKSTLSQAIWNSLFTATNLTPANLQKTMGRWYPMPGGDHARVTLQFEADGKTWTLLKTWGAGAASSLQADGAASIADPGKVQAQLLTLLRRNEATWRHVLFTSQAQLAATIDQLRSNAGKMDEVQNFLAGAAAIPGDVPPEKLTSAIEVKIAQHFGRWDIQASGPEKGRGVDNKWANGVGPLLDSWYAMTEISRDLEQVIRHEQAVDEINTKILSLTGEMSQDDEFVRIGRTLRDGLGKRSGLEERCKRLAAEIQTLRAIMSAWPGADQVIQGKETELAGVIKDIESLETELKNARKRIQAEQLRTSHQALTKAKEAWRIATDQLAASKSVSAELLTELKNYEKEIDHLRIQIAAQKLSVKLESPNSVSINIQRGISELETITLSPSKAWEGQADGIFRIDYQDLKLSVESGTGDVNALFTQLETARNRHTEILKIIGHESLVAAQLADTEYQKLIAEEKTKNSLYQAALQTRSEEEWASEMNTLAELPETRSVEVLESEKTARLSRKARLDLEIKQEREKIAKWKTDHIDLDSLTDKILDTTTDAKKSNDELAGLPMIPEGFSSISEYLDLLSAKESALVARDEELKDLKIKQATLAGAAPESTAEELLAELEIKQREFERQHATGTSLLRIQTKLQELIAARGIDDPMESLSTSISSHFSTLTAGRYQEVTLDGATPTQIGGTLALDTPLLSQGTLGSLALATRLALSELYLKDMEGFFLLDDPFTDMDSTRRTAAIQSIGTFAQNHQVLFFTCHPEHAGELKNLAGAKQLEVAQ